MPYAEPSLQPEQRLTEACCVQLAIDFLLATTVQGDAANGAAQR